MEPLALNKYFSKWTLETLVLFDFLVVLVEQLDCLNCPDDACLLTIGEAVEAFQAMQRSEINFIIIDVYDHAQEIGSGVGL
mgnify:CR=1 FL=1